MILLGRRHQIFADRPDHHGDSVFCDVMKEFI